MKLALTVLLFFALAAPDAANSQSPLTRPQRGAQQHDAMLAALGEATVACLGAVSTRDYRVNSAGILERAFASCTTRDTGALERVDQLLGVQGAREAQEDRVSGRFSQVWTAAERRFPARAIPQCPTWELLHVIDAPTIERVAEFASKEGAAGIGKEYRWYKVSSAQCGSNGFCAVLHASLCGAGYSDQFIVWLDPLSSSVIVDPVWWLTDYEYEEDNPFLSPIAGYKHPMSYFGDDVPGELYGSLERAGETCTKWSEINQKHFFDRKLIPIDCGGGWFCMTYCN